MFAQLLSDPKVFQNIIKRRYQMRFCHECDKPARFHYGHFHSINESAGILVVAGHCEQHIKLPSGADAGVAGKCIHQGAGCGGVRMFKVEELRTTWY